MTRHHLRNSTWLLGSVLVFGFAALAQGQPPDRAHSQPDRQPPQAIPRESAPPPPPAPAPSQPSSPSAGSSSGGGHVSPGGWGSSGRDQAVARQPRGRVSEGGQYGPRQRIPSGERAQPGPPTRASGVESGEGQPSAVRRRVPTSAPTTSSTAGAPTAAADAPESTGTARRRYPGGQYTGVAVPRPQGGYYPPGSGVPGWGWSGWWNNHWYYPGYWYWAPVGWGLGYWTYYDPWWWRPVGYSYGVGYVYDDAGSVRLKVRPREAQVFVDGYAVGIVDSFDGVFQKLYLNEGPHHIEIRLDGYQPLVFDVYITVGHKLTLQGRLQPAP